MNRFLSFFMLVVLIVVCIGFFRGWFSVTTNDETFGKKLDVHFQVDRDKMQQDANAVEAKTKSLLSSEKNESQLPR